MSIANQKTIGSLESLLLIAILSLQMLPESLEKPYKAAVCTISNKQVTFWILTIHNRSLIGANKHQVSKFRNDNERNCTTILVPQTTIQSNAHLLHVSKTKLCRNDAMRPEIKMPVRGIA